MLSDFKTKTLTELRAELVPTKRDALIQLNGSDRVSEMTCKYRKDKQIESQVETFRDVETDALLSTRTITYTYYDKEPGAPVDEITIVETDMMGDEVSRKVIKHYFDGRQPEVK